jgi:type II secretory pathway component PulJ
MRDALFPPQDRRLYPARSSGGPDLVCAVCHDQLPGAEAVLEAEVHALGELSRWQNLGKIYAQIEADLQDAVVVAGPPGGVHAGFVAERGAAGEAAFSLSRLLPEDVEGGTQRVLYRFASRQLSRSAWSPSVQDGGAQPVLLLEGLDQASFRYMDAAGNWQGEWVTAAGELPRAVEMVFKWPDGVSLRRVFRLQ